MTPDIEKQFFAALTEWQNIKAQLAAMTPLVLREKQIREQVFGFAFPTPKEGTNKYDLPASWVLEGKLQIARTIDEAVLSVVKERLRAEGFNADPIVRFKPEVAVKEYKAMPEAQRLIFDTCLTIKPQLPSLALIPPKEPK